MVGRHRGDEGGLRGERQGQDQGRGRGRHLPGLRALRPQHAHQVLQDLRCSGEKENVAQRLPRGHQEVVGSSPGRCQRGPCPSVLCK